MTHTQNPFVAQNLATAHTLKRLTLHCFSSFEKWTELNMAASKALMAGSFHHAIHLQDIREPQQLLDLQLGLMVPVSEKIASYGLHVFNLATDVTTELNKAREAQMNEAHKTLSTVMSSITSQLPAGSGGQLLAIH